MELIKFQNTPSFGNEEAEAVKLCVKYSWLTEYKETEQLEKKIARFLKVKHAIMTTSGTMALILASKAIQVNHKDTVLVPALTMIATANAPKFLGANIKFIDIDETGCMDIEETIGSINKDTKAVIYVSLNGRSNNLDKLKQACKEKRVYLIEDACQSLGSKYKDKYLGTIGDIGCFSLSPHKIISTGQGGVVVTDNDELARRIRMLKDFGRLSGGTDYHEGFGINAKFTDLQAVVGLEQLRRLRKRIEKKKKIYKRYYSQLKGLEEDGLKIKPLTDYTPWMVDVYCDTQLELKDYLDKNNIGSRLMYPALYEQPCYADKDYLMFGAYEFSTKGIWLPSSIDLTMNDIDYVCNKIREFYGE